MIICWDNLEKLRYNKRTGYWYEIKPRYSLSGRKNYYRYQYADECKYCKNPFLMFKDGKGFCSMSCAKKSVTMPLSFKKNLSEKAKKRLKNPKNHPNYKGGYSLKNIPTYDTYAPQIQWCEKVRRNKKDKNILEVKCAYCGKWYVPTLSSIASRINVLNGKILGEYRLYCSNGCKKECPIYRKIKYPKGYKKATSREVQPELRQMVLKRDNYTCKKCGSKKSLHCHHVEGIRWDPLESADIDKCITLCKKCHKKVHKKEGCGYNDMKCEVI